MCDVFSNSERGREVNKNDLVSEVANGASLSKADAARAVDAIFDTIKNSLSGGGEVRIVGFGTSPPTRTSAAW